MMNIKLLKREFYIAFYSTVFIMVILLGTIIVLFYSRDPSSFPTDGLEEIVFYSLLIVVTLTLVFCSYYLSLFCKDLTAVKQGSFEQVTGRVIRFLRNENIDTGQQMNLLPIIAINGTEKTIKLVLSTYIKIGVKYTFAYLKHTGIAVVIAENDE